MAGAVATRSLPVAELRAVAAGLGIEVDEADVTFEELTDNRMSQITEGIWRVRSAGFDAVVKVVVNHPGGDVHWQPSTIPTDWNYWRREADAYRSGLTDAYAASGVRGPRPLAVVDRDEASIAVWMESVSGRPGSEIDDELLGELSYRLGKGQGSWTVSGATLPPWASRRFLRRYISSKALGWDRLDDDSTWALPLVAECFPAELRAGAIRLHRDREWLLQVMEALPRTLAHLDVWPNNVVFADDGATSSSTGRSSVTAPSVRTSATSSPTPSSTGSCAPSACPASPSWPSVATSTDWPTPAGTATSAWCGWGSTHRR